MTGGGDGVFQGSHEIADLHCLLNQTKLSPNKLNLHIAGVMVASEIHTQMGNFQTFSLSGHFPQPVEILDTLYTDFVCLNEAIEPKSSLEGPKTEIQ